MAKELAFALINPYTISKSRTGGIIARIVTRTGLEMVSARMFGPSAELAKKYADLIRTSDDVPDEERELMAGYVERNYAPDAKTGKRRRVMMILFEGEDAIEKVFKAVGVVKLGGSGQSVRETYGDYIMDDKGQVQYFEPAVMIARSTESVGNVLKLWGAYSEKDGGIIQDAVDVGSETETQRTLVIIKPDNFKFPSARPGNIIDIFSASGLRIVCAKVHRMSVAEAEEFYGPVREVLRKKLKAPVAERATKALNAEFGIQLPEEAKSVLGETIGPLFGDHQFFQIVQFMTGHWLPSVAADKRKDQGSERCLVLVYAGVGAVEKIRKILGPTDPSKAEPGSVRREYGQDIMINAAHASDSPENAKREMGIVRVQEDRINHYKNQYYK